MIAKWLPLGKLSNVVFVDLNRRTEGIGGKGRTGPVIERDWEVSLDLPGELDFLIFLHFDASST